MNRVFTLAIGADAGAYDRTSGVIPEPGSMALLGLGLIGLAARRCRKKS